MHVITPPPPLSVEDLEREVPLPVLLRHFSIPRSDALRAGRIIRGRHPRTWWVVSANGRGLLGPFPNAATARRCRTRLVAAAVLS